MLSGYAKGIVVAPAMTRSLAELLKELKEPIVTSFEKGVNAVSCFNQVYDGDGSNCFVINGSQKDWLNALLFAISVAVGLTPEMLPMIVTAGLAKGAIAMSKEKVIIRIKLNSKFRRN